MAFSKSASSSAAVRDAEVELLVPEGFEDECVVLWVVVPVLAAEGMYSSPPPSPWLSRATTLFGPSFFFIQHPSQTRTSCVTPMLGSAIVFEEHCPQNVDPQARQWCLRFVSVKVERHRVHTSESVQSGG